MSNGWIERDGGIWDSSPRLGCTLIVERFDSRLGAFEMIWQRHCDGHFQVEFRVKDGGADPQWSLPFWHDIANGGIFDSQSSAEAHLRAIAAERVASLRLR